MNDTYSERLIDRADFLMDEMRDRKLEQLWEESRQRKNEMNTPAPTLPAGIEAQLEDLETRHKRHQRMLDEHHNRKHDRREAHRARHWSRKPIPITLV